MCVRWSAAACAYCWRCGGGRGEGNVVEGGAGCVWGAHYRPNYPSIPLLPIPHAFPPTKASLTHHWWCTSSFRAVGCMWGRQVHSIAHVRRDCLHAVTWPPTQLPLNSTPTHPPCPPTHQSLSDTSLVVHSKFQSCGVHVGEACALNCTCGKGLCARRPTLAALSDRPTSPRPLALFTATCSFASGMLTS